MLGPVAINARFSCLMGECIDAQSARENYKQIRRNMVGMPTNRDWCPCAVFIHWEGASLECAHSGREIPSAYGFR